LTGESIVYVTVKVPVLFFPFLFFTTSVLGFKMWIKGAIKRLARYLVLRNTTRGQLQSLRV
jgi:hypothetical protein